MEHLGEICQHEPHSSVQPYKVKSALLTASLLVVYSYAATHLLHRYFIVAFSFPDTVVLSTAIQNYAKGRPIPHKLPNHNPRPELILCQPLRHYVDVLALCEVLTPFVVILM